jgi:hypothetical protein
MKKLDINSKFQILSCYNEHGTMIRYDDNLSLTDNTTITHSRVEFITALFNNNTHDAWNVIAIYKP